MTDIKKNRLKYVLWAMIPFLVALYIHFSIYFPLDPFKLTPILIAKIFFIAIFSNAGLALITLNISGSTLLTVGAFMNSSESQSFLNFQTPVR